MPAVFGMGGPALAAVTVLLVAAVTVVVLPAGRGMLAALAGSVARWPGLIREELRGGAPLRVDGPVDQVDAVTAAPRRAGHEWGDTTPDIPAVTQGLPVVERRRRV